MTTGVLARAARIHDVPVHAAVVMSNHFHLLISVDDAKQMADFMRDVKSGIARETNRLIGWKGPFWDGRYHPIIVSEEEAAQVGRLSYLLAHGVKEDLVEHVTEWPGLHCAEALMTGRSLVGTWHDRTKSWKSRQKGDDPHPNQFAEREILTFTKLPCWAHMSDAQYRAAIEKLVAKVEEDARLARGKKGVLGVAAILAQDPETKLEDAERRPAPRVHAASRAVRQALIDALRQFELAYRAAAERLREGHRNVTFPEGCFPPGLPFVPFPGSRRARASPSAAAG